MDVIKYPDPRLLKPCKEVAEFGPELTAVLNVMWETMKRERGMGMAANQIGLDFNMFVMEAEEAHFFINPKILEAGKYPSDKAEGCLSAPGEMIRLYRPDWVKISYQDPQGNLHENTFVGIHSVCVQHEMEHLEGKTFLQNKAIPKRTRIALAKKWGLPIK
jgi:peptide deformylase